MNWRTASCCMTWCPALSTLAWGLPSAAGVAILPFMLYQLAGFGTMHYIVPKAVNWVINIAILCLIMASYVANREGAYGLERRIAGLLVVMMALVVFYGVLRLSPDADDLRRALSAKGSEVIVRAARIAARKERANLMREDIVPGAVFPDYALTDHTGKHRKLSELQGPDPMILILSREASAERPPSGRRSGPTASRNRGRLLPAGYDQHRQRSRDK